LITLSYEEIEAAFGYARGVEDVSRVIITPLDKPSGLLEVHIETPDEKRVVTMSKDGYREEVKRYEHYCKRNKYTLTFNFTDDLELPKLNEELQNMTSIREAEAE